MPELGVHAILGAEQVLWMELSFGENVGPGREEAAT